MQLLVEMSAPGERPVASMEVDDLVELTKDFTPTVYRRVRDRAYRLLEQEGWAQGAYQVMPYCSAAHNGAPVGRCLVGAIRSAAAIEIFGKDRYLPGVGAGPKEPDRAWMRKAFREGVLIVRICDQIWKGWKGWESGEDDETSQGHLITWNDVEGRTKEQVLAAIKGTQDALTKPVTEVVIGDEPVPLELPEPAPERVAEPDKEPVPA